MFPPGFLNDFKLENARNRIRGETELVVDYIPPEFVENPLQFITFVTKIAVLDYGIDLDEESNANSEAQSEKGDDY